MKMENTLRLIKKDKINKAAQILAECFADYPLYLEFFPNEKTRQKSIYWFYKVSLYSRMKYTYVTEGLTFIGCIKYPGAKANSIVRESFRFCNLACYRHLKIKTFLKWLKLDKLSAPIIAKYYDDKKDIFIEAVCIKDGAKDNISLANILNELYNGETIVAETADERLVRLYRKLGFDVCETIEWGSIKQNILRKVN